MSNLTDLQGRMECLRLLLVDAHPGIYSWRLAYERAVEHLLAFFDADPQAAVRAREEAWDLAVQQTIGDTERKQLTMPCPHCGAIQTFSIFGLQPSKETQNVPTEARPVGFGG